MRRKFFRFLLAGVAIAQFSCQPVKDYYQFVNNTDAPLLISASFDDAVAPAHRAIANVIVAPRSSHWTGYDLYTFKNTDPKISVTWQEVDRPDTQKSKELDYTISETTRDHTLTFKADGTLEYVVVDSQR